MKRFFDLSVSSFLLFTLLPLLILIAVLVMVKLGTPILFKQRRPGYQGKPFTIYKFRSLADLRDKDGNLLDDSERFSRFSSLLRKSSLDELPELINVLKGDMSLVGPRPLLMAYLERYDGQQARRHDVLPGVTGWAQVNGRNAICWEEKFKLDVWYVDNHTFWLDLKILFLTIIQVYKGHGVNQDGHVTAEEFMGSAFNE